MPGVDDREHVTLRGPAVGGSSSAPAAGEVDGRHREVQACSECGHQYSPDSRFCPFDGTSLQQATWVAPTDPTVDPILGTVVDGRYRVKAVLGEGGTGTVYEVVHETLARSFAMKVMRRDVAADDSLAARFIQEARATAALKHPHVVSITDFGRLPDQTPYFVMERLVGQTLAHVCKVNGQLPLSRAVDIVLQVAGAMVVAHDAGVIHRDLKPENLFLVSATGGDPSGRDDVRVVDFGAAKIAGASRITKTGIVFGTPHYMSPEQASGQPVDHRADVYALGVIMYELFAGHLPFEGDTLMGVLTKHLFVEPPPFARAQGGGGNDEAGRLLEALEALTFRALAKKPEDRFQSMSALATALEATTSTSSTGTASLTGGAGALAKAGRDGEHRPKGRMHAVAGEVTGPGPSGSVPTVPVVSWGRPALIAGVLVAGAGVTGAFFLARNPPSEHPSAVAPPPPPVAVAPAASTAVAAAALVPPSVHMTTMPDVAEVWQDGRRVGTTPTDLPAAPSGSAVRYTVRLPGYLERQFALDGSSGSSVHVTLDKASAPAALSKGRKPPPPNPQPRHAVSTDGELVDPFSR